VTDVWTCYREMRGIICAAIPPNNNNNKWTGSVGLVAMLPLLLIFAIVLACSLHFRASGLNLACSLNFWLFGSYLGLWPWYTGLQHSIALHCSMMLMMRHNVYMTSHHSSCSPNWYISILKICIIIIIIAYLAWAVVSLCVFGWWRGIVGNAFRLKRSKSTPGLVSTAMGDCLRAGKPFRCKACQLSTLRGTVKWVVTHLHGLWKVGTLVQLTGVALPAAAPACVCRLHTVAVWQAALVSDESALEACLQRCAIQIDDLYLYFFYLCGWWPSATNQLKKRQIPKGFVPAMQLLHGRLVYVSMSDEVVDRMMHWLGSKGLGWLQQPLTERLSL